MKPEQYGFILKEIQVVDFPVQHYYRQEEHNFVVLELPTEYGNGLINSCLDAQETPEGVDLLSLFECQYLLALWQSLDEQRLLFFSNRRRIRALEFLDYTISEFGLVRGTANCASGQISLPILSVQMSDYDLTDITEYFLKLTQSYFICCDWIDADTFGKQNQGLILDMQKYYKKKMVWAYVKSTDVVEDGEQIRIKSLENESGMLLTAGENRYIMIGCRGEVYDIEKEKFLETYEKSQEPLDIFTQMLDFLPAIEKVSNGDYISLDGVAHLCYPVNGIGIYAKELERRTKVFPAGGQEEYYLGRQGDFLAIRIDDFSDVYIIQREIFLQTYES